MRFTMIKLSYVISDSPVYINVKKLVCINPLPDREGTEIVVDNGRLNVRESVDEVLSAIDHAIRGE